MAHPALKKLQRLKSQPQFVILRRCKHQDGTADMHFHFHGEQTFTRLLQAFIISYR